MGKIKKALIKLSKKVTGKDLTNEDSIGDVVNFMADNYEGGGGGSTVVANPTLAGTEDTLTGLEVGGTKYVVGGNGIFDDENIVGAFKLTFDRTEGVNPEVTYYNINKSIECVDIEFNIAIIPVANTEKERLTRLDYIANSLEELGDNAGWFLTESQLGYSTGSAA